MGSQAAFSIQLVFNAVDSLQQPTRMWNQIMTQACCNVQPDCKSLGSDKALKKMIEMSGRSTTAGLHDSYLNFSQYTARKHDTAQRRDLVSLKALNTKRSLIRAQSKLACSQELLQLLAESDVPRARQLLARCLREGRSYEFIIHQVHQAIQGLYNPKSFDHSDFQVALLVHRLGSRKLLYALSKSKGLCSRSSLYDQYLVNLPRFECCALQQDAHRCIHENLSRFVYTQPCTERCMWLFIIDDVAVDERLRWDEWTNKIVGICREHSAELDVTFDGTEVLDRIKAAIERGEVHYGSEATVGALVPLRGQNYSAIPLFVSLTCKKNETASSLAPFMESFFSSWYLNSEGYEKRGPCGACISDGAANFRLAAAALFNQRPLRQDIDEYHEGEMFKMLSHLRLFDTSVGRFLIVDGSDDKHGGKRFRERVKSLCIGMLLSRETLHSKTIIKILHFLGETPATTSPLFAPDDAMNVEATVRLFKTMHQYKDVTLSDLLDAIESSDSAMTRAAAEVEFGELFLEFRLLASICSCLYLLLGTNHLSVSKHLSNLSTLAHLLFVVFRKSGTAFIAAQTYENWQSSIKEHYFIIARCKVERIQEPYYVFQDSGQCYVLQC